MSVKVLVTDYAWPDLAIEEAILERVGAEIISAESANEATLVRAARGATAIMTNWASVTSAVIDAPERLQIVARLGVGIDNIDVDHATRRGVPVTNVPNYCVAEVAEHTIALLLALGRNVAVHHHDTKSGTYDISAGPPLRRIAGRTLGIVGLGNIGRAVASRASALGLRVLATSRACKEVVEGVQRVGLDELLKVSDYVSLHAPLSPDTRGLISEPELSKMKPGAFLINTARGGLVDHGALASALEAGRLAGAALDVQEPEPPPLSEPPFSDPRVIVTPHSAFVSEESLTELRTRAARQVAARLAGETPPNVVNPAVFGAQ